MDGASREPRERRKPTTKPENSTQQGPGDMPIEGPPYPPDHPLWQRALAAAEAIWAETDPAVSVEDDDAWLRELRESGDERLTRIYEDPDS